MKQVIKEEIYKYVQAQNLTQEEITVIDNYVLELLESLEPLFKMQEKLNNEEFVKEVAELIVKDLGG